MLVFPMYYNFFEFIIKQLLNNASHDMKNYSDLVIVMFLSFA